MVEHKHDLEIQSFSNEDLEPPIEHIKSEFPPFIPL